MVRKIRRERLDAVNAELSLEDHGWRNLTRPTTQRDDGDFRDDDHDWSVDDESGPLW